MSIWSIGIDLGGTRTKSVVLDPAGNILEQSVARTRDGDDRFWKQVVAASIEELVARQGIVDFVVGIAAPGLPNAENSAIAHMPGRLQGLEGFDWSSFIGRSTWVVNDAVAALLAESSLGVALGKKHVVLITLGTGVGGAILIDGKPYQGSFQKAGHIGHICLDTEGDPDVTGMPGSLEDAIGNVTVHKRSQGKFSDTGALLEAIKGGDLFARQVWLHSVKKLAIGIAGVTNILSPECVILAGGITLAGQDLFGPLEEFLSLYEWRAGGHQTEILQSKFGDMAGAIGAACFAQSRPLPIKSFPS
jgi:glucokinase